MVKCIEMCQSNVSLPQIKLDALKLSVIRYGFHCFLGASYVQYNMSSFS